MQQIINGTIDIAISGAGALAFCLIYLSNRGIDFALVPAALFGGYLAFLAQALGFISAVALGAVGSSIALVMVYLLLHRHLEQKGLAGPHFFLSGLGLVVVGEAAMALVFGSGPLGIATSIPLGDSIPLGAVRVSVFQATTSAVLMGLGVVGIWWSVWTEMGLRSRASGANPDLALVRFGGLVPYRAAAYAAAGLIAGGAVIVAAMDSHLTPGMALPVLLDGLIGFLIGGTSSAPRAFFGGILWGVLRVFSVSYVPNAIAVSVGLVIGLSLLLLRGRPGGLLDAFQGWRPEGR